jgi:hypothetical protein
MALVRVPTVIEKEQQHQDRIDAKAAQVECYGQSRSNSAVRHFKRRIGVGRPGCRIRLTAANWTREVSSFKEAAVCLGCAKTTAISHVGGTWDGVRIERV